MKKEDAETKYYLELLKHLHLDFIPFCQGVAENREYETLLDSWIKDLFKKNKPIEEAKVLLIKLRHEYFFKEDEAS
ncbi:hypothetical protein NBT05_03190 [Aquimarina sp. ERC-38]|uniref:hypothetical protein n=1 Tax=Aquimarina sp. ERC-38 TaxID=2949996 RepID=UPI002247EA89|nr:hypothetical protein [Aquimarina sp. ERC-38]UZO81486.1 hypothetical protein NBT05_03190 [Aquimarina sp. ERC-38]